MHLEVWQIVFAVCGAYGLGLAKTGITGIGIVSVALFAIAFKAASLGIVLPLLVLTDTIAVLYYRRHAVWSHLWRLFLWAAIGIVLGWIAMRRIDADGVGRLIGALLLFLIALQVLQRIDAARKRPQTDPDQGDELAVGILASGGLITISLGLLAGFVTMVANASGPLFVLYLLAARLPKMEFVGTGAWCYFVLNLFKVPFSLQLGLINLAALRLDLMLAPVAIAGALSGRVILPHINQRLFENMALFFTTLAALKLLIP